jgi:ParB/RepB/Spo0J family partition protein
MAKFKVKKIAVVSDVNNVVANNDIVNEVATTVANEIVNSEVVVNSEIEEDDDSDMQQQNLAEYKIVSLDDIIITREDNRLSGMDAESILDFSKVLKRDGGVRCPIEVYYDSTISKYRVISGHRRYLASVEAGFRHIKTMVYNIDHNDRKLIFKMRIIENIERVNLSAIDTAKQMKYAFEELRMTKKAIAKLFSLEGTRKYYGSDVTKIISLLELPEESQKLVHSGSMSKKTAYELLEGDKDSLQRANRALKGLSNHMENLTKKQQNKLCDNVVQDIANDYPESGIPIHPPTTESNDSEIETPESTENSELVGTWKDSQNPESRIDPNLKLTPEGMFPETDEPTPVSSRRSSPNDITPPTTKSDSENESESDFDVEAQLKAAGKETRNKEMSKESIIGLLTFLENGTQGFPICGFLEDLMSAIVGHEDAMSRIEMVELLKEFVLAPKKSKKK